MKSWIRYTLYSINILCYVGITAIWIAFPTEMTLNLSITMFNLCLTSMIIILDKERFSEFYTSKKFKKIASSLVSVFLIFCILGLLNYLSYKHPQKVDFTRTSKGSLTEKSIEVLEDLSLRGASVTFKVFAPKEQLAAISALLELYRFHKLDVEIDFVDIELRPDLVKEYQVNKSGSIIVEYGKRRQFVKENSELEITNALIRISRTHDPVIMFTIGHQEIDIESKEKSGMNHFVSLLKKLSYKVETIDLTSRGEIPANIDSLIIWGPKTGFMEHEINQIDNYLKSGGRIMIALDPDLNGDKLKDLRFLFERKGIKINNNLVIDTYSHVNGSEGTVPLIKNLDKNHDITSGLKGPIFFPLSSSIKKVENDKNFGELTLLALTSFFPNSWAENTPKEVLNGDVKFNSGVDDEGPIGLAAAWESYENNGRIVVFGNSTLNSNVYANYGGNFTFVLNALSWLVDKDSITSFNLPIGKVQPIFITSFQQGLVFYFSVIITPLLLFGLSFFFYKYRKRL